MSTNISKKKRDDLLDKIKQIRAFIAATPQDENTGNLLSYLSELEKDVNGKKYGLVFEEHREEIDEVLDTHTPVLTEEADLFIDHGGQMNFLLEGDNLAALKLLEKTHRGKIDLIYIDPPYNTGNKDFIYDDAFVDKNDCFTHSKWLSFMEKRLKIARRLLSGNGVVFISIDDREEAGLRLLCDEIFGENCFVSNISWQRNYSARNDSKGIVTEVEHLLVYSRSEEWSPKKLPRTAEMDAKYKNPDNDFAMWRTDNAYAPGASTHQGMVYAIQHPFTGEMLYPANGRCWTFGQDQMLEIMRGWCAYELRELDDAYKRAAVCGVKENEVRQGVQAIVLSDSLEVSKEKAQAVYKRGRWPRFFFTKGGKGGIARKTYLSNVGGKLPTNLWLYADVGHTDEAKKEIMAVFDSKAPFSTPKPTRLIERILQIASNAIRTENMRLNKIVNELKKINADTFPNACGTLLRALFELSAKVYLEKQDGSNHTSDEFESAIRQAANGLRQQGRIDNSQHSAICKDIDNLRKIFNGYMHNTEGYPSSEALKNFFKCHRKFIQECLR